MSAEVDPIRDMLINGSEILRQLGHVCGAWWPQYPNIGNRCNKCGGEFKVDPLTGKLLGTVLGPCPGASPEDVQVVERPVDVITLGGSDLHQTFATDHPLLPPGVSYNTDADWVVAPEGEDLLPVEKVHVEGLTCIHCECNDKMQAYRTTEPWRGEHWVCAQCPNCRKYLWVELHRKE